MSRKGPGSIAFGGFGQKDGMARKRAGQGITKMSFKVPRASGQTQTRQEDGHLGMSVSLNKVVERGVKQMPLLTLCMCVFLRASVLFDISVMTKGDCLFA